MKINNRTLEDCARCGTCKARCPIYELTLNESHSPRGRLMLLRGFEEGTVNRGDGVLSRLMSCSMCGLCDLSCPVGLRPTEFIYKGRALLRKNDRKRFLLRLALKTGLKNPGLGFRAAKVFGTSLIFPIASQLPAHPLKSEVQVIKPKKSIGRIGLFTGCSVNYIIPEVGQSLINILLALGYEVILPKGEHCCGAPLRGLGLEDEARKFAEKNLDIFGKLNVEAVLSPCPTCTLVIKEQYRTLLGEGVKNAVDAVKFLSAKIPAKKIRANGKTLLWHESCHLKYGLGFDSGNILEDMDIHKSTAPGCCGFGLAFTDKALSNLLLEERKKAYGKADMVITACPACMLQLEKGGIKTLHLLELMEEAFFGNPSGASA